MADSKKPSSNTLAGLPTELRLEVWKALFRSIIIEVQRGNVRVDESTTEWEPEDDGPHITVHASAKRGISPLPDVPADILSVKLVCRDFASEIRQKWHSGVTYSFPSTVAFVDVLSQWNQAQVVTLRHVYVCDTPFPLYGYDNPDYYITHELSDALAMFPGLQLDVLTVENIWLFHDGRPLDGWCEIATFGALKSLLFTRGWRTLHYRSGILPLMPNQWREIEEAANVHKEEHNEPDYAYDISKLRPRLDRAVIRNADGTTRRDDKGVAEIQEWYAEHPQLGHAPDHASVEQTLGLAAWARRGVRAPYVEDGSKLTPVIKKLLENMSWTDLRQVDDYLVNDGLDDPTAHL